MDRQAHSPVYRFAHACLHASVVGRSPYGAPLLRTACSTTVGMPDHTGVVKCREGRLYTVWDCNISGNKTVQESTYNLMDLEGGNVKFYRAL